MNKNPTAPDVLTKETFVSQEVFRFENPDLREDVGGGNERYVYWIPGPHDKEVSAIAGWDKFYSPGGEGKGIDEHIGRLQIPMTTISSSSALAGREAWHGEKTEILDAMSKYQRQVYHKFGMLDTSVRLDTVAVPRGNYDIFVLPPHNLVKPDEQVVSQWLEGLYSDLYKVLNTEPRRDELIGGLQANLDFLKNG